MHNFFEHCGCGECDNMHDDMPHMPLIGDMAPEFIAETTNGEIHFPSDYTGKWVVLFSHPADFTPVCTTEFMAFQSIMDKLHELNTELVGLSVGTLTGHLAWIDAIRNIKYRGWENVNISFPIIDDMNMQIAKKYGMIHPNTSDSKAVRAVFIIDPTGKIRAILYYPLTTGRNMDEILRLLMALQTTDNFGVSTPVDWQPGDDVLVGAPATTTEMHKRINNPDTGLDVKAWFLSFKPLSADTIMNRIQNKQSAKKNTKK